MNSVDDTLEIVRARNRIDVRNPVSMQDFVDLFFELHGERGLRVENYLTALNHLGRKVLMKGLLYAPDESGLPGLLRRRLHDREFQDDYEKAPTTFQKFEQSEEFIYVSQFVARFGSERNDAEVQKLRQLLAVKDVHISYGALSYFLDAEFARQRREAFRERILLTSPSTVAEVFSAYLHSHSKDNLEQLEELSCLLGEMNFGQFELKDLRDQLHDLETRIELEYFERQLAEHSERLSIDEVDGYNGAEFESFLAGLYKKMGYKVEQTRLSGDQGADLVLNKFGVVSVVQAKCYAETVGNYAVQEIVAARSYYRANDGIVVTNNYFTPSAKALAAANQIVLIDRDGLSGMIEKYY